jgi:tubulin-folding cofactor B
VIDSDDSSLSAQGWLEDVSKVTKYVMSEQDYLARDNTYRKFKEQKLKEDPTWTLEKEMCARKGG